MHLSVEYWLDLDLTREVELLGRGTRSLVPLLEDLPEAHCVYLDELLERKEAGDTYNELGDTQARPSTCSFPMSRSSSLNPSSTALHST